MLFLLSLGGGGGDLWKVNEKKGMKREPEIRDFGCDDDSDAAALFCSKFLMLIINEQSDNDHDDDVPKKTEVKPALLTSTRVQCACGLALPPPLVGLPFWLP